MPLNHENTLKFEKQQKIKNKSLTFKSFLPETNFVIGKHCQTSKPKEKKVNTFCNEI